MYIVVLHESQLFVNIITFNFHSVACTYFRSNENVLYFSCMPCLKIRNLILSLIRPFQINSLKCEFQHYSQEKRRHIHTQQWISYGLVQSSLSINSCYCIPMNHKSQGLHTSFTLRILNIVGTRYLSQHNTFDDVLNQIKKNSCGKFFHQNKY